MLSSVTSNAFKSLQRYYSTTQHIQTVGVIGGGQMGSGIAQVLSQAAKKNVIVVDLNKQVLEKSLAGITSILDKNVAKGKMSDLEKSDILKRLSFSDSLKSLANADFVIEAVIENAEIKCNIFKELDQIVKKEAILATNTSSISITKIAAATKRPQNVIGMHFMNPVPVMKLVEIIPGISTSEETQNITNQLTKDMGKVHTVARDTAGFIANRLLMPYINEACQAVYEGLGTIEDIDTTMKLGCNMPMGPLTLADFIGLDTCLSIMKVLQAELGDKYKPSPLLIRYVEAGKFGKKSNEGFYSYFIPASNTFKGPQ
ncbi:hypothetical protein CYY_008702 [Polysphondylium violaceum]|uniref:3-hydroxybutyryl-CoA dehydrogenase n=1 Tax=Polysphondylium violaceum TaxID=133409 RepID=A0A8J4UQ03_9MYCE|nr:hypothetical protein CYY_008702 [Polysphondylium violaceum]